MVHEMYSLTREVQLPPRQAIGRRNVRCEVWIHLLESVKFQPSQLQQ
jgi:hypothetical protein